jgi:hypothetical protein
MQTTKSIATVVVNGQGKKMNVLGHSVTVKLSKTETQGNHYVFEVILAWAFHLMCMTEKTK